MLVFCKVNFFRLVIFLTLAAGCTTTMGEDMLSGKVVKMADGDSFTLLVNGAQEFRIRLHGVDCPENGQPYGKNARQFSSGYIFGKTVKVQVKAKDRYGRIVGMVLTPDGTILNEALLKNGWAWHYKQHDNNPEWADYEREARKFKKGLWSDEDAIAPWEWRKQKRR